MAHEPNRTGLPSEPPSRTPSIDELQSETKGCCCRGWTLFWNRFSQQRLKGYTPIWTVHSVVMLYLVLGIIFLPVGIALLLASLGVETQDMRYDNVGPFANLSSSERQALLQQQGGEGLPITFEMRIEADMDPPVYMYIQLHDFHQNVRSCFILRPLRRGLEERFLDLPEEQRANLTDEGLINPCGLIAWSQLNDTVDSLSITEGGLGAPRPLPFDETGISWSTDREWLFGNYNATNYNTVPSLRGGAAIDGPVNTEEHLLVWMRVSARPRARKLYAVIDDKLREGDVLRVNMTNRYNTYDFSGKKAVFLTTTSWAGGRSILLGVLWIAAGSFWVMSAAALTLWNSRWPRAYGDLSLLSWRKAA